jgi:hypothetical protein
MTKRSVTNTTKQDLLPTLLEAMIGGPSALENQERRGQAELAHADVLPTEGLICDRDLWTSMGVQIGDPVDGDPLFHHVALPAGWKKVRTDHPLWSHFVDERGRKRALVGYKAAFYDRWASLSAVRRFAVERDPDQEGRDAQTTSIVVVVKDCDQVVFRSDPISVGKEDWKAREGADQAGRASCAKWLADHGYPNFADPAAYWDEPQAQE